jgi:hypothetical protein
MMRSLHRGKELETTWEELERDGELGQRLAMFRVGEQDDQTAPTVLRVVFPPGWTVTAHTHAPDYAEIVLNGSVQVSRRWYHAGDIRVARGGTVYGPVIAGPEGATVLIVFRDSNVKTLPPKEGVAVNRLLTALDSLAPEPAPAS